MDNEYVSRYPKFWRRTPRSRTLAIGIPLYNELEEHIGYKIMGEDRQTREVRNEVQLRSTLADWNCDLYLSRLYGHGGFLWFVECLRDRGTEIMVSSASQTIIQVAIRINRSSFHIASAGNWSYSTPASQEFMEALRHVLLALEMGTYSSPSALGHALFQHLMQQERGGQKTKRPPTMLYEKLYQYGVGGRAEDFSTQEKYKQAFEIDRGNSFGQAILDHGVPLMEDCETYGTTDVYSAECGDLARYATAYCQAEINIPGGYQPGTQSVRNGISTPFSPFAIRLDSGELEYPTESGIYRGYWWLDTLKRCEACGYCVRIAFAYCWTKTSDILRSTVERLVEVRNGFKEKKMMLESDMVKQVIVSFIGRFGMHQEKLNLILEEDATEEDEPFLNLQASQCESLRTPFYLHKEQQGNEPHLVQIAQHVINWNNLELYDRQVAEEQARNKVIATNFDAIFLKKPSRLPMNGWKQLVHTDFRPLGRRSYESYVDGKRRRRRPGVRK